MKSKKFELPIIMISILLTLSFASCDTAEQPPAETSPATEAATVADTQAPAETTTETTAPAQTENITEADEQTQAEVLTQTEAVTEAETLPEPPDGSFATEGYTVSRVGDAYYLNFTGGNELTEQENKLHISVANVFFSSLAEMRDKIKNNTLSDYERATVKLAFPKDENGIKMFNINQMYQPVYPEGFICANDVLWTGDRYSVYVHESSNVDFGGYFAILSRQDYEEELEWNLINPFSHINYTEILSEKEGIWDGVPCTEYVYNTPISTIKRIFIEYIDGEDHYFITIAYLLDHSNPNVSLTISDSIPYQVRIWGETDGQCYSMRLFDFSTTPTLEFLTSFGITPYVEPDAEITPVPGETQAVS